MLYVKTAWIIRKTAGAYLEVISSMDEKVIAFLKENPNPSDAQVHTFAEENEVDIHDLERIFYRLATKYVQSLSKDKKADSDAKGFSVNIEKDTIGNANFRKVLYTGKNMQLVLMSLKSDEDIGDEVHKVDQFFRVEKGSGEAIINGNKHILSDGISLVVPAGSRHNLKNTGSGEMKLYSIYSPPQHQDGVTHKTKDKATEDEEYFDGKTSE
jgi:mannose-6-phosphate isomerase-like protein (cupin superfamily)